MASTVASEVVSPHSLQQVRYAGMAQAADGMIDYVLTTGKLTDGEVAVMRVKRDEWAARAGDEYTGVAA